MHRYSAGIGHHIGKCNVFYGRNAASSILNRSGGGSIWPGKDGHCLYSLWTAGGYGCDSGVPKRHGAFPIYHAAYPDWCVSVQSVLDIRCFSDEQNPDESVYFLSGFLDTDDSHAGYLLLADQKKKDESISALPRPLTLTH